MRELGRGPWRSQRQDSKASSKPWPVAPLAGPREGQGCLYCKSWLAGQELSTQQAGLDQDRRPGSESSSATSQLCDLGDARSRFLSVRKIGLQECLSSRRSRSLNEIGPSALNRAPGVSFQHPANLSLLPLHAGGCELGRLLSAYCMPGTLKAATLYSGFHHPASSPQRPAFSGHLPGFGARQLSA